MKAGGCVRNRDFDYLVVTFIRLCLSLYDMDYYTENPKMLEGQPKRAIADYVERNGILVPRRFDTLEDARKSHRPILLRSEHTQEYDGASGLLESFQLSDVNKYLSNDKMHDIKFSPRGMSSIVEIKEAYFKFKEDFIGIPSYEQYCTFLGLDEDKFKKEISFSLWEEIGGIKRTVIADSAIPSRHHVTTFHPRKGKNIFNYTIVENGKISEEFIGPLPNELKEDLGKLVGIYEDVRRMERFDPNHCPIMEFRTHKGKNYFLQYHRARDFSPSEFTLNRELADGETEAQFVRGATPEDGMDCKVTVYYATSGNKWDFNPDDEDGSYDLHWNQVFPEIRVRKRKVQMTISKDLQWEIMKYVVGHFQRSKLFKPQVSIIHDIEDVMHGETVHDYYQKTLNGENSYLNLHIVSDGRRAFIRRI